MKASTFLRELWGDTPPGYIQLWRLEDRRSFYLQAPIGADGYARASTPDIYTAVATAGRPLSARHRARADQTAAIAGLWLDLDIDGGPDNKTGAIATVDDAVTIAHAHTEPTIVVNSGYGIHAWYLLDQPWRFRTVTERDDAARASSQWYALHRQAANKHGWGIDHTHDLARLLRLPGTLNGKGADHVPVDVVDHSRRRYPLAELLDLCKQAGDVPVDASQAGSGGALPDIVVRDPRVPAAKLDALLFNSDEFAVTWRHARGADARGWSLSEYDLSIATQLAQSGWTDQEIADTLAHHRRLWDPTDTKAARLDYLRRTIAKARDASGRSRATQRMRDLLEQGRRAA